MEVRKGLSKMCDLTLQFYVYMYWYENCLIDKKLRDGWNLQSEEEAVLLIEVFT